MKHLKKIWIGAALGLTLLTLLALSGTTASPAGTVARAFVDTDNPADQVRALAGELAARDRRLEELEERLSDLLRRRVPVSVGANEPSLVANPAADSPSSGLVFSDSSSLPTGADLRGLTEQIQHLSAQMSSHRQDQQNAPARPLQTDISPTNTAANWLDLSSVAAQSAALPLAPSPAGEALGGEMIWLPATTDDHAARLLHEDSHQPRMRVPAGATATDIRLLTSLIGRIPRSGQVVSPLPFKALVGAAVLAAPGHLIPELRGAMLMGDVVGDLLLNCVRGHIRRATLIGSDGRYAEVVAEEGTSLGYLSDERGNPCLPGQLVTNFPRTLLAAGLAAAVETAGEALAAEQQIRQTDLSGIRLLTEDADAFLGGSALAGSAATLGDWIRSRASDSFDAVVVPSGGTAVANFTRELEFIETGKQLGWQR